MNDYELFMENIDKMVELESYIRVELAELPFEGKLSFLASVLHGVCVDHGVNPADTFIELGNLARQVIDICDEGSVLNEN